MHVPHMCACCRCEMRFRWKTEIDAPRLKTGYTRVVGSAQRLQGWLRRGSAGVSGDDRFMSGKADETRPETGEDPEGLRSKYGYS
jgi:hypothetical protein